MLGFFYLECVSDFQIVQEFSNNQIFGFVGEIDVVFEKIVDFLQNR